MTDYIVFLRGFGERKWTLISKHRTARAAYRRMAEEMESGRRYGNKWKRGVVLAAQPERAGAREGSYYEPLPLVEMQRCVPIERSVEMARAVAVAGSGLVEFEEDYLW